jgi:hypothetical protein
VSNAQPDTMIVCPIKIGERISELDKRLEESCLLLEKKLNNDETFQSWKEIARPLLDEMSKLKKLYNRFHIKEMSLEESIELMSYSAFVTKIISPYLKEDTPQWMTAIITENMKRPHLNVAESLVDMLKQEGKEYDIVFFNGYDWLYLVEPKMKVFFKI